MMGRRIDGEGRSDDDKSSVKQLQVGQSPIESVFIVGADQLCGGTINRGG